MTYCEPPKGLLFCLDYDETYTEDPELWDMFIELIKSRGHRIICATMRYEVEGEEIQQALSNKVERIIFTDRKAKTLAVKQAGYYPSIWIDDSPHWIIQDSQ